MVLGKFLKVNEFSFVINTHSDLRGLRPRSSSAAMDNAPIGSYGLKIGIGSRPGWLMKERSIIQRVEWLEK